MFENVPVRHSVDFHGQKLTLETGLLAKEATASVLATIGDTSILAVAVVGGEAKANYFPLQIVYEERLYASGKIKGSRFIKREGRPTDNAILTGRMVDRSLRSLFNSDIRNDIQVVITVLSVDEINPPDTLSVLAASAALKLCGVEEFDGPVSSVRVGLCEDDIKPALTKQIISLIQHAENFSDLTELLTDLSSVLDVTNEDQKGYFAEVFYKLKEVDSEWASKFKTIYQNTEKLTEEEIEEKFLTGTQKVVNPSYEQQKNSDLDLVISGDGKNIMMLESGANIVAEDVVNESLDLANSELKVLTDFQNEFITKAGDAGFQKSSKVKVIEYNPKALEYWQIFASELEEVLYKNGVKLEKDEWLNQFRDKHTDTWQRVVDASKSEESIENLKEELKAENEESYKIAETILSLTDNLEDLNDIKDGLSDAFGKLTKKIIRKNVLENEKRLDGRDLTTTRQIGCQVGIVPRVHGSSLFSRGETQVLNVLTLGTKSDAQLLDDMEDFEERTKRYIHHYNFPSYSVGETGRYFGPGRREIGHGALAEKALLPVLPSEEDFPYTMRLVSECMGSNGSTSMASTCSSCLSLMQGGVPIKGIVAGVAMGLILDNKTGNFKVLTDIQGIEDHYGDMDFKVTGTETGITAIQLDNKVSGLTVDILKQALVQSKNARLHILDVMKKTISEPNKEMSPTAPRVLTIDIPLDKVGDVIGPSGKVIKSIISETGVEIDIEDTTGKTHIYSTGVDGAEKALQMIQKLIKEYEAGETVEAKIFRIESYGAFAKIDGGDKEGLIHISQLADKRVEKVEDIVKLGDVVEAKIVEVNDKGQIALSLK